MQLWKFLEYSCVKNAAFLKTQLSLQEMQLPESAKKRQKIGHKLQKSCRTRWLSMDKAIQGVYADYGAIMLTLNMFEHDATACGLLCNMKSVKFIGAVYLLKTVLPILSTVSKCFQGGVVSFAKIRPTLDAAKANLTAVSTSKEHKYQGAGERSEARRKALHGQSQYE